MILIAVIFEPLSEYLIHFNNSPQFSFPMSTVLIIILKYVFASSSESMTYMWCALKTLHFSCLFLMLFFAFSLVSVNETKLSGV